MITSVSYRVRRVGAFVGFTAIIGAAFAVAAPAGSPSTAHMDKLLSLNCKVVGAGTCASGSCHGGGNKETPPKKIGSEFSVWSAKDAHAKAYTALAKPNVKEFPWMTTIAAKLGVTGDLAKSDRCVACHAVAAPAALQGEKFDATEGVSCYQCHGPAEKWLTAHAKKGWTEDQRAKLGHDGLLTTFGLFDTKPVAPRAEMCASCHLAIDEKLVQAGHPQPIFEQLTYQSSEPEHWIEQNSGFGRLNLWAAGQVVAMRESMTQLASRTDAALVAASKEQALAHLHMVTALTTGGLVPGDAAKLKALGDQIDAAAPGAYAEPATAAAALAAPMLATIDKLDAKGDKAKVISVLKAVAAIDPAALTKIGRRGVEQEFFALERLLLAYREGANVSKDDFAPIRASLKPLRDLKLYEKRFDTAKLDTATLAPTLKAVIAKVDTLK